MCKRLKEVLNKVTSDETEVKDENAEEPERRPRHRSRDKDKVSMKDAKSLKLEMVETNLPPIDKLLGQEIGKLPASKWLGTG